MKNSKNKERTFVHTVVEVKKPVLCEDCGQSILKARVEALPNVTRCVKCAAEVEAKEGFKPIVLDDYDPAELSALLSPDD